MFANLLIHLFRKDKKRRQIRLAFINFETFELLLVFVNERINRLQTSIVKQSLKTHSLKLLTMFTIARAYSSFLSSMFLNLKCMK